MGGEGVGGHDEQCDAAYSAGVIACWPRLRETCSCFAEVPLLANIPMLRDFTQSFLQLVQLRDDIEATYTEFAKHPHHFITGDKFKGYFRPQKLPKSLRTVCTSGFVHGTCIKNRYVVSISDRLRIDPRATS